MARLLLARQRRHAPSRHVPARPSLFLAHRPPRRCFSARSADSSTSPAGGSRTCSEVSVDARVRACHADLRRGMLRGHRASRRDSSAGRARLRPGRVGWCGCGALCCVSGAAFTAASIGASSTIGSTSTSSASMRLVGRPGRCAARSYASISRCECGLYVRRACIWGGVQTPKMQISTSRVTREIYVFAVSADQTILSARTAKR